MTENRDFSTSAEEIWVVMDEFLVDVVEFSSNDFHHLALVIWGHVQKNCFRRTTEMTFEGDHVRGELDIQGGEKKNWFQD